MKMSIEAFEKAAGSHILRGTDDETAVLVTTGDDVPSWVRLPEQLGGERRNVVRGRAAPCPVCGVRAWHLDLEGGVAVAECGSHGFLWYRLP
jgi:hypothetical protein